MVELIAETPAPAGMIQHTATVSDECGTKLGQVLFHYAMVIDEADTDAMKLFWCARMVEWMKVQIQCDAARRGLPPETSTKWLGSLEEARANHPELNWPA